MTDPTRPLHGLLVADFSRILAGPLCTMMLADAGARVIKVEQPRRGDETRRWGPPFAEGESAYYLSINRNKESLALHLGTDEGRAIARTLIERADVVVDNFLARQRERLGLQPDEIRRLNPRAVHCMILGFDPDGAHADTPGYDLLAQASGGLMTITGTEEGGPTKAGVALSDVLTAHWAHGAILAALLRRERSGTGQTLEVSLFGATVASLANVAQSYLVTGREPRRWGNAHPTIVPYEAFAARDRMFVVAVATDKHFQILCREILQVPKLADDARFRTNADRVTNRGTLIPMLARSFANEDARHWVERCHEHGIPSMVVAGFGEILAGDAAPTITVDHPTIGPLRMVRNPLRRDGERATEAGAPPRLGEQTDSILHELGVDDEAIVALRERGVV